MQPSFHSLTPFLPSLLNHLWLPTLSILCWTANSDTQLDSISQCLQSLLYSLGVPLPPKKNTASSIVAYRFTPTEMCLQHQCVSTSVAWTIGNTTLLLLRAFTSTGMCLPSRFLRMNYCGFQASCHNIYELPYHWQYWQHHWIIN
jgi:hypothetical protein